MATLASIRWDAPLAECLKLVSTSGLPKSRLLDRYMEVSAANQRRKLLICSERAEARDPEKMQESTFSATC